MDLKNKVKYTLNINKLLFLGLEFIGAIIFSAISLFMYKYGDAILGGFLLPLIVKIFCFLVTIDLWETLYKNIKPKTEVEETPEKEKKEKHDNDDDDFCPRAPQFDE